MSFSDPPGGSGGGGGTSIIYKPQFVRASLGVIDSDTDTLDDGFELWFFGNLDEISTGDPDTDGIETGDEYTQSTDPTDNTDGDTDGLPDDWELFWNDQFAVFPKPISASLSHRESITKSLILNNPISPDADFTVTVTNNLAGAQTVYDYEDSLTGGVVYTWTEISANGDLLNVIADVVDGYEEVTLSNFTFPFYGTNYGSVFVSSNGMISFGYGTSAYSNRDIPNTASPDNFIAPFWEDLDTSTAGEIYVQEFPDRLIVQYEAVAPYSGTGSYTFQAVLHSSGLIEYFYKELIGNTESATVGLENSDGTDGLEVAYNEAYIQDGLAVRITQGPAYFVKVSPLTGTTTSGSASTLHVTFNTFDLAPGTYTADIDISHTGIGTTPWNIPAVLEVTNPPAILSLNQPYEGQVFWSDETVSFEATATDDDFGITQVDFLVNGVVEDQDTSSGSYYYGSWIPSLGEHDIYARTVDQYGAMTNSETVTITVLADTDHDRMDDAWEQQVFGSLAEKASADFDGDGVPNIFEYNHGTDPTDPQSTLTFAETQTGDFTYFLVDETLAVETPVKKKTLSAAISSANDFDVIEVRPGTYNEVLGTLHDRLYVFGSEGARSTVIDAVGLNNRAMYLRSESVFSGLTFQGANPESPYFDGGALYLYATGDQNKPRFIGCRFIDNNVGDRGGAIYVHSGDPMFISCTIAGNQGGNGSAIYIAFSTNTITLINTLLWNPGASNEITGYPASVVFDHSLTRDDTTGHVLIDGIDQGTSDPGLAYEYSLVSSSVARDAGTLSLYADPDLDGELLSDGLKDIGADEFTDTDIDGLPDWIETLAGVDLSAGGDEDGDYLSNLQDFNVGANPLSNDTDGDGLFDGDELFDDGTHGDTDGYATDVGNSDTDGDGLGDGWEVEYGFNPTEANTPATDTDGDGLTDGQEFQAGSNPLVTDTDGDGMPDLYEVENGLNPSYDDAALDKDDDDLNNLLEYQAGTQANYFDSDGDLLPDGFEYFSAHLDPLVPNGLHDDFDGDGLDTFGEFTHGTDPDNPDTDGDGITDKAEADAGSDPLDPLSKPFDPDDYFGPNISDANIQPIGDLGVNYADNTSEYEVAGQIGDGSGSHSERWRLNIGDKSIASEQFGVIDDYELKLNKNNIFNITLSHIATNRSGDPDYDYTATVSPTGFILCDINSLLGTYGNQGDDDYWSHKTAYLIPIQGSGWSRSYSGGDAVGPRYRKVALNGRPMSDEKPEQEGEVDEYQEETYIDAFDLTLRHDTSYIYLPLAASDLVLQANASVRETQWSDRGGLRPHEELTSPFGVAWFSNLCAYIEVVETLGDDTGDPITVNVVDEGGRSQRFGTEDLSTFFPWPSSRVDKKTYLNRLQNEGGELVLTKKYGNTLTYRSCDAWFMYSTDRLEGSDAVRKHTYWRLEEVEDRYGNRVIYDYGTSNVSLIPEKIQAVDRPDQWIVVNRSTNGRRVDAITDARGNTIDFNYTTASIDGFTYTTLSAVDYPDGTSKSYGYGAVSDTETVNDTATKHYHINLTSITDKRGKTHSFGYQFDRTKEYYSGSGGKTEFAVDLDGLPSDVQTCAKGKLEEINDEGDPGDPGSYKQQYGLPRQVASVTFPGGVGTSTFAKTPGTHTKFGPEFSAQSGTVVTDLLGNQTTYTFNGVHGEVVDRDNTFNNGSAAVSIEWMIYYTSMSVDHAGLGSETFTFDLPSGLSLSAMTDFSGNETTWTFDNALPGGAVVQLAETNDFMTRWADPTSKTDALGRVESYQYGDYRVMSHINDVHGTVTTTVVDALGRRKRMRITEAGGVKVREETYTYGDEDSDPTSDLAGFMAEKRVVAYANHSGQTWEQDIVTTYVPDARGRVWKEIVDPAGLALTTEYTYDTNNNRVSVKNPRGNITRTTYDSLNRLVRTSYPVAGTSTGDREAFVRYLYDARGNVVCEVDEEGRYTLHHFDDLSRKIRTIRDMDGLGLPTLPDETSPQILADGNQGTETADDLVTEFTYNAVNSIESITDPRDVVTRNFYDDIQRIRHTYTHFESGDADADGLETGGTVAASSEKTHTEFLYQNLRNPGASGFATEGFKPTQIIRYDAVHGVSGLETLNTHIFYDGDYRETQTEVEYRSGEFATTTTSYGMISNDKESLFSSVTDPLGKITRTVWDGLGRVIEVRDAFGTADEIVTTTEFSSTGLPWRAIDPRGHHTESEFDAAGREVKVWQPDPITGLINRLPADDTAVGSPVTETLYDNAGNVAVSINPRGDRWDFTYDARNRRVREEAPAVADATQAGSPMIRPVTQTFFDGVGNVIQTIDPRLAGTLTNYDNANRPVTATTSAVPVFGVIGDQPLISTTTYDKSGNVIGATDFEGNRTVNFYDALGRLRATASNPATGQPSEVEGNPHADDILVFYHYDDAGNQTLVIDGEDAQTAFRYDGLSRQTKTIWDIGSELQRTKTIEYNAALMTRRTDEKGQVTEYEYDHLHRLQDVIYTGRTVDNRHYSYDANANLLSVTHPNAPDTLRDTASTFDALNRVSGETSIGVTHSYTLDKAGNRLTTTYGQTGRQIVSTYDALNRLETMTEGTRVTTYGYDLAGNIVEKELPNGVTVENSFDLLGRKKTSTNTAAAQAQPFAAFAYAHDKQGNLVEIDEIYPLGTLPDRVVLNTYDPTYRLNTETLTATDNTITAYVYDDAHNRVQKSVSVNGGAAAVTTYAVGDGSAASGGNSNQLVSFTEGANTVTFTYDANGNRATRTESGVTDTYTYDYENRLLGLNYQTGSTDTGPYAYAYDYRTRRVLRDESAVTGRNKHVIVFTGGTSAQEHLTAISGTPEVEYIRGSDYGGGIGGILYTLRSGVPSIKHYNSRGDVIAATDGAGALTYQTQYEAYGTRTTEIGSTPDRQQANTKDEDPTGLLNEGFRYRDLETGTFITRDPLGFVDGPNVYTYVVQNPWSFFDPLGLQQDDSQPRMLMENIEGIPNPNGPSRNSVMTTPDHLYTNIQRAEREYGINSPEFLRAHENFAEATGPLASYEFLRQSDPVFRERVDGAMAGEMIGRSTSTSLTPLRGPVSGQTGKTRSNIKHQTTADDASQPSSSQKQITENSQNLTQEQSKKLKQFNKKTPSNASPAEVDAVGTDGQMMFTSESPGRVPGSKKVYQKTVAQDGTTTSYTKTTVTPDTEFKKVTDSLSTPEKIIYSE